MRPSRAARPIPKARLTEAEARVLERVIAKGGSSRRTADACGVSEPALEAMRWGGLATADAVVKVRAKLVEVSVG